MAIKLKMSDEPKAELIPEVQSVKSKQERFWLVCSECKSTYLKEYNAKEYYHAEKCSRGVKIGNRNKAHA
jgi:acetyl-CoA carboxylase beta subunit